MYPELVFSTRAFRLAALVATGLGAALPAQDTPSPEGEDVVWLSPFDVRAEGGTAYRPKYTTAAGLINTPVLNTPFTLNVLTGDYLRDLGLEDLSAARDHLPNVTFRGNYNFSSDFYARGFRVDTLVNGHRARIFQDNALLDRVELVRGPMAVLYGESGGGGVINVAYKEALYNVDLASVSLGYGAWEWERATLDANVSTDNLGGRDFALRAIAYHGYSESQINWQFTRRNGYYLAARYQVLPRLELKLKFDSLQFDKAHKDEGNFTPQDLDKDGYNLFDLAGNYGLGKTWTPYGPDGDWEWTQENLLPEAVWSPTDWLTLRSSYFYNSADSFPQIPMDNDDVIKGRKRLTEFRERERNTRSWRTDLLLTAPWESVTAQLILGYDYYDFKEYENRTTYEYGAALPAPGPDLFQLTGADLALPSRATLEARLKAADPLTKITGTSRAANGNNSDSYRASGRLDALGDRLHVLGGYRYSEGYTVNLDTGKQYEYEEDSLQAGVAGDLLEKAGPLDELVLYTSYGTTFIPARQLDQFGQPLQPETGEGYDIGLKSSWGQGRYTASLAYYQLERADIEQTIFVPPPGDPTGKPVSYKTNAGSDEAQGFELELTANPFPGWEASLNYGHCSGEVVSLGDPAKLSNPAKDTLILGQPLAVPENTLGLWTKYTVQEGPLAGLFAGVGYNWVDEIQAHKRDARNMNLLVPDYGLWNLLVGYNFQLFRRDATLSVRIDNLLDEEWYNLTADDPLVNYGDGRWIKVSFTYYLTR